MSGRTHAGSRRALLGTNPTPEQIAAYSLDVNLPATTPPIMLIHSTLDRNVPVDQSLAMYEAVRATGGAIDLHIFNKGDHGVGLRAGPDMPISDWPDLAARWQAHNGLA